MMSLYKWSLRSVQELYLYKVLAQTYNKTINVRFLYVETNKVTSFAGLCSASLLLQPQSENCRHYLVSRRA